MHTTFDGDLCFAFSTGQVEGDINRIGVLAESVVADAINRAVKKADGFGKLPAFREITQDRTPLKRDYDGLTFRQSVPRLKVGRASHSSLRMACAHREA